MAEQDKKSDLHIDIIAPSCYDKNDILRQYSRILMLPPSLAVLDGLSLQAAKEINFKVSISHHNERTERGEGYLKRIVGGAQFSDNSIVFITAKTFEVPRSIDIAKKLRKAGLKVVLGGPGITLADWKIYNYLVQEGISFNVGEGENTVGQIIQDTVGHRLKPAYWQQGYVDLRDAALPKLPEKDEHKRTMLSLAGLGTSEGCPFNCSYCCVTKLRGRKPLIERSRNVDACIDWIREASERGFGIMLTDDNYRRSFHYEELKKPLSDLNEELKSKGKGLFLYVQIDAKPDVVQQAADLAAMGVKQGFFGMESHDPNVLADAHKRQNNPEVYQDIVNAFHKHGLMVQSGVMVGFPKQTPESIRDEALYFGQLLDMPHCYAVTPLPGSDDYAVAVAEGKIINWDLNFYDTMHIVRNWFENMTPQEAQNIYWQCLFDLLPAKKLLENRHLPSWSATLKGRSYARYLAEVGKRIYGYPFHFMMDGIPHFLPTLKVKRPVDGFRGFELTPKDLSHKEEYLTALTGQ